LTAPRVAIAATVALAAMAPQAGVAATPDCGRDALAAARGGAVPTYYPSICYDAARDAGGPASVLNSAKARDVKRRLQVRITTPDNATRGARLRLSVKTTFPVRNLRITVERVTRQGTRTVASRLVSGAQSSVTVLAPKATRVVYRIRLGFTLNGKPVGTGTTGKLIVGLRPS
jgi:hypothetical protein